MIEIKDIPNINHEDVNKTSYDFDKTRINGVYLLLKEGEIIYIGQSVNIHSRISSHSRFKFDSYNFIVVDETKKLDNLEAYLIGRFKPKHNSVMQRNTLGLNRDHLFSTKTIPDTAHDIILKEYGDLVAPYVKRETKPEKINTDDYDFNRVKLLEHENRLTSVLKTLLDVERRLALAEDKIKTVVVENTDLNKELQHFKNLEIIENKFKIDFENWNNKISGLFGITIEGIYDEPFYVRPSNDPKKLLNSIKNGKSPIQAKCLVDLFNFLRELNLTDKLNLKFIEFDDNKRNQTISAMGNKVLNNVFHKSKPISEDRERLLSKIYKNIKNYKNNL